MVQEGMMPYRLSPNDKSVVQIKRGGVWRLLKRHQTKQKAKAHLAALNRKGG